MSKSETMCHLYAMNRNGEWLAWSALGWANFAAEALPQAEAVERARYAMNNITWVWGVKIDVQEDEE